jgi:hypothetical protein
MSDFSAEREVRAMSQKIRRAPSGHVVGESHHKVRFDDATVERARQMHDEGKRVFEIAREIGAKARTVHDWINYRCR